MLHSINSRSSSVMVSFTPLPQFFRAEDLRNVGAQPGAEARHALSLSNGDGDDGSVHHVFGVWTVPFSWFCVMYCLLSAME